MSSVIGGVIVLLCSLVMFMPRVFAQPEMSPQTTVKGDLLSINGDMYVVKDIFGRLVYRRIDKNTTRERMLVPEEKIEADVTPGERVLALRLRK